MEITGICTVNTKDISAFTSSIICHSLLITHKPSHDALFPLHNSSLFTGSGDSERNRNIDFIKAVDSDINDIANRNLSSNTLSYTNSASKYDSASKGSRRIQKQGGPSSPDPSPILSPIPLQHFDRFTAAAATTNTTATATATATLF